MDSIIFDMILLLMIVWISSRFMRKLRTITVPNTRDYSHTLLAFTPKQTKKQKKTAMDKYKEYLY